ncbi:hypothetical protein FQN54_006971 [Arachnomyces sp. PD_36]|nr:hypothetical protein FQN54_006971 [Arachnomyces sp. PD_36]
MKFGRNFHLHLIPEWESFYINYYFLKKLYKDGLKSNPPDFTELRDCIRIETDECGAFHRKKFEVHKKREDDIHKRYRLARYDIKDIKDLYGVDYFELRNLLEALLNLRADLIKLQRYDRVNQDALRKIHAKLDPSQEFPPAGEWVECLQELERLDKMIQEVYLAYSQKGTERSLFFRSVRMIVDHTELYRSIKGDNPSTMAEFFNLLDSFPLPPGVDALARALLDLSMTCYATSCIDYLMLERLTGTDITFNHDDLNYLITIIGQNKRHSGFDYLKIPGELPTPDFQTHADPENSVGRQSNLDCIKEGSALFTRILEHLGSRRDTVLRAEDTICRLPLHYGARYGLTDVCHSILESLQGLDRDPFASRDAILSQDSGHESPLKCAIVRNHEAVIKLFLDRLEMSYQRGDETKNEDTRKALSKLLNVALRYQHDEAVSLLLGSHVDLSYQTSRGQTALYVASEFGREDYAKALIEMKDGRNAIELTDAIMQWTPLFVASVNGHLEVVKLLIQAGATQTPLDDRGWTAKEHAAYRGHLSIAAMLDECKTDSYTGGPTNVCSRAPLRHSYQLGTGQSLLVLNIGSIRKGKTGTGININYSSPKEIHGAREGTELLLEICVSSTRRYMYIPSLEDKVYEPFIFTVDNPSEATIVFNLRDAIPVDEGKGRVLGTGSAILKSLSYGFGENRESLIRDRTVPIIDTMSGLIGSVTFTFVIAEQSNNAVTASPTIRDPFEAEGVQLVGHRGLGQNNASHRHLQLSASVVEFDVQLTKDLVPVIYHDFSLNESGTDVPIHDLTLKQFLYASQAQSPRGNPISVLGDIHTHDGKRCKPRSRSLTRDQERGALEVRDRMEHTVDFTAKGFKPNTRGDFIQDSFATLEELLVQLPESLCFNIEIKYPRLHEATDARVSPVGIEINTFVDTILSKIQQHTSPSSPNPRRPIILSSFTPEICILLSIKQSTYPVLFITNAGKEPVPADKELRGASLQVAIRFAEQWGLQGVVIASEVFVACPRLIGCVKGRGGGLRCGSYGVLNDRPENVKVQVDAGIDLLMTDRVGLISKALKEGSSSQSREVLN